MSKQGVINQRSDLVREFTRLLPTDPDLSWTSHETSGAEAGVQSLLLSLDGHTFVFRPIYEITPMKLDPQSSGIASEPTAGPKGSPQNPIDLIVAVRITQRMIDWCKQQQRSAIDLNGRLWLRAPGLMVDRAALPDRNFRVQIEARNIFTGKSERIVRTLLSDVTRTWRQKELVQRTEVSSGLVSRLVRHLILEGHLREVAKKEYRVESWQALLDEWVQQDRLTDRVDIYRYSVFAGDPVDWARKLQTAFENRSTRIAFTQWIGGWMRKPYTEPVITSAYVERPPDAELLEALQLREVPDAGKIWLYVPKDEGVFLETHEVEGLTLVTDAQIYADLKNTGLRGPDQAAALRDTAEFCHQTL